MKTKSITTIMITLFLASIMTIGCVAAYPTGYSLEHTGTGFAELSSEQWHSFNRAVKMGTITTDDRGAIVFNGGPTLDTVSELSYWVYAVQAGTFNQLTAWIAIYLHTLPGKTYTDWVTDYLGGSPNVYYMQAEPYYAYVDHYGGVDITPIMNTWYKVDAFDATAPLEWESLESVGSPHGAPTLEQYIAGTGGANYQSIAYGPLYVAAIKIRMGYGGPWANTLAYVDDVTISDYFENFGVDVIAALEDLKTEIAGVPDAEFKPPAADRKAALNDKINNVIAKIGAGNYKAAIMKLLDDIKPKLDGTKPPSWLKTAHPELVSKIDSIVSILETL